MADECTAEMRTVSGDVVLIDNADVALGKRISLGFHRTPEEARDVYKRAAIKHYGAFARFD